MDVIALVGPSGTGKSHRAILVANQYKADVIIDDGLLIKDGKIIAGSSAKKEKSRIMAVRRAIFILPGHAEEAREALQKEAPNRVLILATSENMIHKIAKILRLPPASRVIRIEDIASETDMKKAAYHRLKEGKHIIPVPTIELKPHFSGYLVDPLQSFFHRSSARPRRKLGEKSIVRPVFSYYGKLVFSDDVLFALVRHTLNGMTGIARVNRVKVAKNYLSHANGLAIILTLTIYYGENIRQLLHKVKGEVQQSVEYTTGMSVDVMKITIRGIAPRP